MESAQELALNTGASALRMAYTIFHDDVSIVDARYYGNNASSAIWMGGDSTSSRLTPSDTGVVLSTGFVSDLTNGSGATNQSLDTTGITGGGRDTDFETIAARRTARHQHFRGFWPMTAQQWLSPKSTAKTFARGKQ